MWKTPKTYFWGTKSPITPPSDSPICLVYELIRIDPKIHLQTKFYQSRTIFTRVNVPRDTYIYTYIYIKFFFTIVFGIWGPQNKKKHGLGLNFFHGTYGNSLFPMGNSLILPLRHFDSMGNEYPGLLPLGAVETIIAR